jgi:pimeloyl-ACP methyl ester carboxylesterase
VADIYKSDEGRRAIEARYREMLLRWPVASEQRVVPTRHGDTFCIVSGVRHAPPLMLFHGSGSNSSVWLGDVAEWSRTHRVCAVDMIGEPGLSAPSRPALASAAYVEWLDDVWEGLGVERASLVGVSLGGWLALRYAAQRPERVRALSVISPSGIGRQNLSVLLRLGLLRLCGEWGLRRSLQIVSGRADQLPRQVVDHLLVVFRSFRPRMGKIPMLTDAELSRLSMPVQVCLGAQDVLLRSSETRARVESLVPQARVMWFENAGHILPPQTRAIADFLDALGDTHVRSA